MHIVFYTAPLNTSRLKRATVFFFMHETKCWQSVNSALDKQRNTRKIVEESSL